MMPHDSARRSRTAPAPSKRRNTRRSAWHYRLSQAIALCLILVALPGRAGDFDRIESSFSRYAAEEGRADELARVLHIAAMVRDNYVDDLGAKYVESAAVNGMLRLSPREASVPASTLAKGAIDGIVAALDPHSGFLDVRTAEEMRTASRGRFGGLGMEVATQGDTVKVVTPIDDTPAFKAGIQAGDLIVSLDGEPIRGLSLPEAVKRMRGPIGSTVRLGIERQGRPAFEVSVTRAEIRIVAVSSRVESGFGYVRVKTLNEGTGESVRQAVDGLKSALGGRLPGLILDLRNHPGGLQSEAVAVADAFLESGRIVSGRSRGTGDAATFDAKPGDVAQGAPVITLVNGGTASGAELIAAALRANSRTQLVGTTTFGKGNVQTLFPQPDGAMLKLTTQRMYVSGDQTFDGKGLQPDIVVLNAENGPDEQLSRAIALLRSGKGVSLAARAAESRTAPASRFPGSSLELRFRTTAPRADDIAVIIGNADYSKTGKDIPDVLPAYADAEDFRRYALTGLGIREGNIIHLRDATSAQMVRVFGSDREHRGQLFDWVRPGKSRVFIYYSGHGAPGESGSYLVPSDADAARINLNGYPLATLYRNLSKLPAVSVTLVLEACFSGTSQTGSVIAQASPIYRASKPPPLPANITIIAAGAAEQIASWEEDSSHGLFTKYFLKAMAGEADADRNGTVDDAELQRYLDETLTYFARRYYGRDQRAQITRGTGR